MSFFSAQDQRRTGSRHLLCKQRRVKWNKIPSQMSEYAQVHLTSNQQLCPKGIDCTHPPRISLPSVDTANENTQNLLSSGLQSTTQKHVYTAAGTPLQNRSYCFSCQKKPHSDSSDEDLQLCVSLTRKIRSSLSRITQLLWSCMCMRHVLTGTFIQVMMKGEDHFSRNDGFPTP